MTLDEALEWLGSIEATVCFTSDGIYVVTASIGGGTRLMETGSGMVDGDPPGVRVLHNGYYAQHTSPCLIEATTRVRDAWLSARSAVDSLGERAGG